jgi:hypothetical protein
MIYENSFLDFFEENKLGKWNFDATKGMGFYEFSFKEFKLILDLDIVHDEMKGGLILGNLHSQGGIHLIKPNLDAKIMTYVGEMEGWEYLSSPVKSSGIGDEFEKINNLEENGIAYESTEFVIPSNCKVVDTLNKPIALLIISEYRQFIVNRFATRKYINELIQLDLKNAL